MKHSSMKKALMGFALASAVSTAMAVDPCGSFSSMSGGTQAQNGGTHDISGTPFNYEMWTETKNPGSSSSMTYKADKDKFQFQARWSNDPNDLLCRIGLYWGGGNTPRYSDLNGDLHCEFNFEKSGSGGGYNYIGVYGWTKSPTEVEYYIVENCFFNSNEKQQGNYWNSNPAGSYTMDGDTYELRTGTRTGPSISGNSTFTQIYAIRRTQRKCGHVSISAHMREWEKKGLKLGQLYDCKFLCEVGAGTGSFDLKYGNVWVGSAEGAEPAKPTETEEPYNGKIAIPGKLECENYDKGGNGFGYYDTDNENEGDGYRKDGVDIVKANDNWAIGYTTDSEWLKYTINVEESATYNVGAYMANGSSDPKISLSIDGKKAASLTGVGAGDWDTYAMAKGTINLTKGEHTLVLNFDNSYTNIDYLVFSKDAIEEGNNQGNQGNEEEGNQGNTTQTTASGEYFDENGAYFGPSCDDTNYTGAYYTGNYTSPFKSVLGKTDAEIQAKLDQLWNHYFVGSNKVYFEKNDGSAYILDTGNNDVRSEGMSYGMMICVQTNHKAEFDKLWAFAKKNMLHTSGQWQGYFKWQCNPDGSAQDANCAPDGEMYFTTALMLAANRWGQKSYMDDAQYCLKNFWKNGTGSLFNEQYNVITFQPYNCSDFSDPSYDLPAFLELFSRWSTSNNNRWNQTVSATRDHLYKSCNTSSGLFTDYNNFDGTPHAGFDNNNPSNTYLYDAMRCAMNYGMDCYLFGKDAKRQTEMAKRIIDHFEKDGYKHARFNWDGSVLGIKSSDSYTLGETGANAVACYALMNEPSYATKVKTNLNNAWNASLATGTYRYYDGLVHYLSMLHLCGSFKIYKPTPDIKTKEVKGSAPFEFNGVEYTESATTYSFEDCQLYKVNISIIATSNEDVESEAAISIAPNPASSKFTVNSVAEIELIKVMDMSGRVLLQTNNADVNVSNLSNGTYVVVVTTTEGDSVNKLMIIK
ncbi:MAG: glycosyl hydrolase family 8 [Paludibacteraceae bacterium]|nr:glycosyl hydrolase family 8 [Paludibacteraceae bacterium]